MLTGELPIGRFAPPSKKVQIDVRLDEVVLRALEKEPERRYQQASEIKTEVETIATTPGGTGELLTVSQPIGTPESEQAQHNRASGEEPARFQFSLRMFLIVICGLGVAIGLLGRLYVRRPEIFVPLFAVLSLAVPFLLAIGTAIHVGFRRKPSHPRILVAWAGLLLLMPLLGLATLYMLRPGDLRRVSTQELIEQRLPMQIDEPWVWNELESRLRADTLSQQEVDDAVKELISFMTTAQPGGWNKPLSWQRSFLASAVQAKKVSDQVLVDLCDAYFGSKPSIVPLPRLREGTQGFSMELRWGNPFGAASGPDLELLWRLDRVLLDGKRIFVRQTSGSNYEWSGYYDYPIPVGDHLLAFEIESAYVDRSLLTGLDVSEISKSRWPPSRPQALEADGLGTAKGLPGRRAACRTPDRCRPVAWAERRNKRLPICGSARSGRQEASHPQDSIHRPAQDSFVLRCHREAAGQAGEVSAKCSPFNTRVTFKAAAVGMRWFFRHSIPRSASPILS